MSTIYDKRILLTGGAGFIGSHTLIHFVTTFPNYYVLNVDSLDYCATLNNLRSIEALPNYRFVEADICELSTMKKLFADFSIDTVIHLAAKSHVDLSFQNPLEFIKSNVVGTNVLLICAKEFGIKRFLHISTDEVYGGTLGELVDESSILNPTNPYSGSKAAAECIVRSYFHAFKIPIVTVRCNNLYGPNQFPEKVVPKFISLISRNKKCFIHGRGQYRRSFMYVTDAVAAFDIVLHKGKAGEVYNIGTDFEISILELAKDLIRRMKRACDYKSHVVFVGDRPYNDDSYRISWEKMRALGWNPTVPWHEGIEKTIEWYNENNRPESHHWDKSEEVLTAFPQFNYEDMKSKPNKITS